jgi:hypothetical protein
MNKVTILNGYEILVNSVRVGHLDGRKEIYVVLGSSATSNGISVARFKRYLHKSSARTLATRWVKFVLARMSVDEVLNRLHFVDFNKRVTPMQLAWDLGLPRQVVVSPPSWAAAAKLPNIIIYAP